MKELKPTKYILSNLDKDETLVAVLSSSKGLFNPDPDVALTNKRIFGREQSGESNSFAFSKIKNIEAVPDKALFGREKDSGKVVIYGPYKKTITIYTDNVKDLKQFIEENISK